MCWKFPTATVLNDLSEARAYDVNLCGCPILPSATGGLLGPWSQVRLRGRHFVSGKFASFSFYLFYHINIAYWNMYIEKKTSNIFNAERRQETPLGLACNSTQYVKTLPFTILWQIIQLPWQLIVVTTHVCLKTLSNIIDK